MTATRVAMFDALDFSAARPTKTYVIEAHVTDSVACLSDLATSQVEQSEDAYIFRVATEAGVLWVDQLDERFWRIHTDVSSGAVYRLLREWVGSRCDLDWMWLPSDHLRHVWPGAVPTRAKSDFWGGGLLGNRTQAQEVRIQLTGRDADHLLNLIADIPEYRAALSLEAIQTEITDPHFGSVREGLNRWGQFAASGDSPELHLRFVSEVVDRYRRLVELCEAKAIRWQPFESGGGGRLSGAPIVINFSREVEDVGLFADELTSSREPFRLWGTATVRRGVAQIEAVDLHVGQMLQIDVGSRWLRVYFQGGTCGNTVARLISNLQHRFDGELRIGDPEIDAAVRRSSARSE